MAGTLQIRDVPEDVSRELKARAAAAGQSLSQYALTELIRVARRPRIDVVWADIETRAVFERADVGAAELIRAERDARP
ncbi:MAG: hypothetical protein QM708_09405 [Propioniciclava sp.]|uniref:FitA-like ribbon-helix-helix domain-containing protein n=1 Tax=Propioniciclava sp. TaxID=2038686 RepID=UPI0039E7093A